MPEYYVLMCDANSDGLESVDDYEMGSFELLRFCSGSYFDGSVPAEVRITLDEGDPADLLGNPLCWLLISDKLQKMIEPFCRDHVQFIPITLWKKGKPIRRYTVANPLGSIDAIVARRKNEINIERLVLDASRIPADGHLFRLTKQETMIVISDTLFEHLHGKGLKGLAAFKVAVR
jgi:hypothetical protein